MLFCVRRRRPESVALRREAGRPIMEVQPVEHIAVPLRRTGLMKKTFWLLMAVVLATLPVRAADEKDTKETERLDNVGTVMEEILNIPDNIPQDLLDKAECVVVFPSVLKFAIGFGGSYGRGVMTCRSGEHFTGPWGAPTMMALEGGSFGFQLGGQATDFVILV